MKKKKALFIATVGGFVTQFELNNVALLQKMGVEIHCAANYREPVYCVREQELTKRGIVLHQVDIAKSPFMFRENLRALKQICGIIRDEGITLIHCHTPVGGLLGRLAGIRCRRSGLKVIYTAHGFHFYKGAPWRNWLFYYTVERALAHFTDVLVTINQEDERRARRMKLRKGGLIYRIPGEGLRMERFRPVTPLRREELRRRLGLENGTFFILSVGELSGNKNHREMIRMMPKIKERLGDRRVFYGICGDGFYREELEELIVSMGLQDCVKLYGYQENIADYLGGADCMLFPSLREGLGMAALEAMAMGLPVVASDNRGTREYMEDGKNGFVCDLHRPESFLDALERVSRMGAEELAAMGEACRRTAAGYALENTSAVMAEVYIEANAEKEPERRVAIHYLPAKEGSMRKAQ